MENKKLSFADYYKRKQSLIKILQDADDNVILKYEISKYTKISLGENASSRTEIRLVPGQKFEVSWMRTPEGYRHNTLILESKSHNIYWKSQKLKNWLDGNTTLIQT
jgi:hypothetical protein